MGILVFIVKYYLCLHYTTVNFYSGAIYFVLYGLEICCECLLKKDYVALLNSVRIICKTVKAYLVSNE